MGGLPKLVIRSFWPACEAAIQGVIAETRQIDVVEALGSIPALVGHGQGVRPRRVSRADQ